MNRNVNKEGSSITWSVRRSVHIERRDRINTIKVIEDLTASVTGTCTRCKREFPAIGLVPVDQWVPIRGEHVWYAPTKDAPLSGHWGPQMHHIIGWFCAGCKPRNFGRIRGNPSDGWVERPTDGSSIDPPDDSQVGKLLRPMGQTGCATPRPTTSSRS